MFFRARRSGVPQAHLEWRVVLFAVGAALGLAGIFLEQGWLTGSAIVVLSAGVLLGFLAGPRGAPHGSADEEDDGDEESGESHPHS